MEKKKYLRPFETREYLSMKDIARAFGMDYGTFLKKYKEAKKQGKVIRERRREKDGIKEYHLEDVLSALGIKYWLRDLYPHYESSYDKWAEASLHQGKWSLLLYVRHCRLKKESLQKSNRLKYTSNLVQKSKRKGE